MGDNQFAIELEGAASLITGEGGKFAASWRYRDQRSEGGGRPRPIMIMIMSRSMIRSVRGGGRRSAIGNRTGKKQTGAVRTSVTLVVQNMGNTLLFIVYTSLV